MRRMRRAAAAVAIPAAAALLLAGCGGGGSSAGGAGGTDTITIDGSQPQNPLIPSNTVETGGGNVLDHLFTGLIRYDTDTGEPVNAVAESIESSDAQNFDITLKSGWTFHDGTPVTAQSFVDAWNWGAYGPNGTLGGSFFSPIEGYSDVNPSLPDGAPEDAQPPAPTAETMSGLNVVSDTEFTVKLTEPYSPFQLSLGYLAFAPLPQSFYDDPEAFGRNPIGNGPYKFVSWQDNVQIETTKFDEYAGDDPGQVQNINVRLYQDQNAAYADLQSGNLDFQQTLPTSVVAGGQFETDLAGRSIDKPVLVVQSATFPLYDQRFQNAQLRKAFSEAIDRDQITQVIFGGTRIPADSYSSPGVPGYEAGTCGEACTYDPEKAKADLAAAGGFQGEVTLSYNADGDHKAWTEAACNSITSAIDVPCVATPVPTFADFRQQITQKEATGLFRTGWQYDYPSLENLLSATLTTGAGSNDSTYSSPEFDAKMAEAAAESDTQASNALYIEAEKIAMNDLPVIPLWSVKQQSGYSANVDNVKVNVFGVLDWESITLTS